MPRRQACFGRDVLKLNPGRRGAEFDVRLRLGRTPGDSQALTENVNSDLKTSRRAQKQAENESESLHCGPRIIAMEKRGTRGINGTCGTFQRIFRVFRVFQGFLIRSIQKSHMYLI